MAPVVIQIIFTLFTQSLKYVGCSLFIPKQWNHTLRNGKDNFLKRQQSSFSKFIHFLKLQQSSLLKQCIFSISQLSQFTKKEEKKI